MGGSSTDAAAPTTVTAGVAPTSTDTENRFTRHEQRELWEPRAAMVTTIFFLLLSRDHEKITSVSRDNGIMYQVKARVWFMITQIITDVRCKASAGLVCSLNDEC